MAVLVDDANWPWRGRRWAHLVSDRSYDELHEAARLIGQRRLGFQGDHYDIDEIDRERALANGARSVDSRKLVRRLRESGLRRSNDKPSWIRLGEWPDGVSPTDVLGSLSRHGPAGRRLGEAFQGLDGCLANVGVVLFADSSHLVGLLELAADFPPSDTAELVGRSTDVVGHLDYVVVGEPRIGGDRSIELFMAR